jgi:hypothetical protein
MAWLLDLRLIRFFGFYLALFFLLSTFVRWRQYHAILVLVGSMPGRWPRLLKLVREHSFIFLTWGTITPSLIVGALFLLNWLASRWLWPQADEFTAAQLVPMWQAWPVVLFFGLAMLAYDVYGMVQITPIDRTEMDKYFDQAEYWLGSWTAPVVRVFTLGYVNPRQMVAKEVQSALLSVSQSLNSTLWWVAIQTVLRICFGLSLWIAYALGPWLSTTIREALRM